jgi:hypothetical protein
MGWALDGFLVDLVSVRHGVICARGGGGVLGWLPQRVFGWLLSANFFHISEVKDFRCPWWGFGWLLSLEEAGGAADLGGNEETGLDLAILRLSAAV